MSVSPKFQNPDGSIDFAKLRHDIQGSLFVVNTALENLKTDDPRNERALKILKGAIGHLNEIMADWRKVDSGKAER